MKRFFLHFYFDNLATVFLAVLMMFAFVGVPSAFAKESSGWVNFGTTNPPDSSCPGEESLHSWSIMDESTGQPAIVEKVNVQVKDNITSEVVASSSQTNVSETSSLCYDPTTQAFFVSINVGDNNYYDCGNGGNGACVTSLTWQKEIDGSVSDTTKNKRYVGHIYVRPKSFLQENRHHVSPTSDYITMPFLNSDPPFTMELRDLPNTPDEGEMTPLSIWLYITGVGWMDPNVYSISTKGTYTKGPFGLADGAYGWGYYFVLYSSGGTLTDSSWSGYEFFMLDRVAPVVSASISPVSPTSADTVTINSFAQDVLSGLASTTIYVDDVQIRVFSGWPFGGTSIQREYVYVGPFAAGTTHSYYAVAQDRAGNVTTSTTGSFTIASGTLKICPNGTIVNKRGTGTLRAWYDSAGSTMDCGALPSTAIDKTSSSAWSSDGTSFVTVNTSGTVTGVDIGSANITATYPGTSGDTVTVGVICTSATTCDSEKAKHCPGEIYSVSNSCGGPDFSCNNGTRSCDYNWKEVAP